VAGSIEIGLHVSLLFTRPAARVRTQQSRGGKPCRFVKPAGENGALAQRRGFAGEREENGLRHILGIAVVAREPPCNGIDQVDVPAHQFGEGGFGIAAGKFLQQGHVACIGHLTNYPRPSAEWDKNFSASRQDAKARKENIN